MLETGATEKFVWVSLESFLGLDGLKWWGSQLVSELATGATLAVSYESWAFVCLSVWKDTSVYRYTFCEWMPYKEICVSFGFVCGFMVHVWAPHRKCINQSDLCGHCTGSVVANQILSCYCCYYGEYCTLEKVCCTLCEFFAWFNNFIVL